MIKNIHEFIKKYLVFNSNKHTSRGFQTANQVNNVFFLLIKAIFCLI